MDLKGALNSSCEAVKKFAESFGDDKKAFERACNNVNAATLAVGESYKLLSVEAVPLDSGRCWLAFNTDKGTQIPVRAVMGFPSLAGYVASEQVEDYDDDNGEKQERKVSGEIETGFNLAKRYVAARDAECSNLCKYAETSQYWQGKTFHLGARLYCIYKARKSGSFGSGESWQKDYRRALKGYAGTLK